MDMTKVIIEVLHGLDFYISVLAHAKLCSASSTNSAPNLSYFWTCP